MDMATRAARTPTGPWFRTPSPARRPHRQRGRRACTGRPGAAAWAAGGARCSPDHTTLCHRTSPSSLRRPRASNAAHTSQPSATTPHNTHTCGHAPLMPRAGQMHASARVTCQRQRHRTNHAAARSLTLELASGGDGGPPLHGVRHEVASVHRSAVKRGCSVVDLHLPPNEVLPRRIRL